MTWDLIETCCVNRNHSIYSGNAADPRWESSSSSMVKPLQLTWRRQERGDRGVKKVVTLNAWTSILYRSFSHSEEEAVQTRPKLNCFKDSKEVWSKLLEQHWQTDGGGKWKRWKNVENMYVIVNLFFFLHVFHVNKSMFLGPRVRVELTLC